MVYRGVTPLRRGMSKRRRALLEASILSFVVAGLCLMVLFKY